MMPLPPEVGSIRLRPALECRTRVDPSSGGNNGTLPDRRFQLVNELSRARTAGLPAQASMQKPRLDGMGRNRTATGFAVRVQEGEMVRTFASLALAATLMALASSDASAWVCRAAGAGAGGW